MDSRIHVVGFARIDLQQIYAALLLHLNFIANYQHVGRKIQWCEKPLKEISCDEKLVQCSYTHYSKFRDYL